MNDLDIYKTKLINYINSMKSNDTNQAYRAGYEDGLFDLKLAITEDRI